MGTGRSVACGILALCMGCGRLGFDPRATAASDGGDLDSGTDSGADSAPGSWWDPKWRHRIKLTIDNPGPRLDGFPVMVRLDPARIDYAATQSAGADLRFVDADGTTQLPHEVEQWNPGGASYLWVRVPEIDASSTTDHFWLYHGNPAASDGADAAPVWKEHALVWHLAESPGATIRDSTGNANHGATAGAMPEAAQAPGKIAGSLAFDGVDDWITAAASPSLRITGDLTFSAWVNVATARAQWIVDYVSPASESEANNHLYELAIDSGNRLEFHWEYGGGDDTNVESSVSLATGTEAWVMITVTRNAATNEVAFYENGIQLGTVQTYVEDATGGTDSSLWLAGEVDPNTTKLPLAGRQDEVRITGIVRSAAWIRADHRSTTDALLTFGAPETY